MKLTFGYYEITNRYWGGGSSEGRGWGGEGRGGGGAGVRLINGGWRVGVIIYLVLGNNNF